MDTPNAATVTVGTPAPESVTWADVSGARTRGGERASARDRILEAAYGLFSSRGIRAVGTEEILATAGVSKSTLYRHFRSKDQLVLAFLQQREQRWTREFVEAEARRRGSTPREQLLAIFDVFDEWFHRDDFEGCSFINVLLEAGDLENPVGKASAAHLEYIRSVVAKLAEEAGVSDPESFAHSWHILMKGSIVAAGEGDASAASRAKAMGEVFSTGAWARRSSRSLPDASSIDAQGTETGPRSSPERPDTGRRSGTWRFAPNVKLIRDASRRDPNRIGVSGSVSRRASGYLREYPKPPKTRRNSRTMISTQAQVGMASPPPRSYPLDHGVQTKPRGRGDRCASRPARGSVTTAAELAQ